MNFSNNQKSPSRDVKSEDLNKILEVARALATTRDLDEMLELIIRSASEVMRADRVSLFLNDEETNELFIRVAMGEEMKEIRFPSNIGIAGHVFLTGEIVNIHDAYQDPRFNRDVDIKTGYRTQTILTMPLNTGEKIVGVLQVINKEGEGVFESYDEAVMGALASQAAVSIHNFRLLKEYLEKQEMQASLNVARTIQKSFLPDKSPEVTELEISAFSESCDETGGDYYDYYKIDENHLIIVIGDVTGHGVGSAMLMATARSALHALWRKEHDPQILLESLNDLLEQDMGDDRFITIFLGIFDMSRRVLTYSSAGHDAPILFRPSSAKLLELDSTGIPLGMMEEMKFPNKEVYLKPGDIIYLMTDGVWEAMNHQEETYGRERLFNFIKKHEQISDKTCSELVDDVTLFCEGASQRDDITLMTVGIKKTEGPIYIHRERELKNLDDVVYEATFASTPNEKNRVLDELMERIEREFYVEEDGIIVVRLCFDEALVNAVDHGNENDPSKEVTAILSRSEDHWSLRVIDEGKGFANEAVPNPDDLASLELDHGRGVLIMTEFMDAVWYNELGNELQIIRRFPIMPSVDE